MEKIHKLYEKIYVYPFISLRNLFQQKLYYFLFNKLYII